MSSRGSPDWVNTRICVQCGRSHAKSNRLCLLAPMAHLSRAEIVEAWPCFYPEGEAGRRQLFRDLKALRERRA